MSLRVRHDFCGGFDNCIYLIPIRLGLAQGLSKIAATPSP
jgi:hypothetical protein